MRSLKERAMEVNENAVVVTPPFQDERISRNEDRCSSCFRKLKCSHQDQVSIQKAIRVLAAICALGLLGGVTVSVWFIVKILLKPTLNSPTVLEDAKETSFCNISDDSNVFDPSRGMKFTSKVCLSAKVTKHKGVNLTDIEHSYTDGFVQITSEQPSNLEHLWQFRGNCSTGKILALKCFDCGTRAMVPRIIGGVDATLGRWPWQVSLYYNNRHTCGGSIITSQWIITAAHCVSTLRHVSSWMVYAGIVTRDAAKVAQYMGYTVEKIIYNKNYNHRNHDSDIALMKLRNPFNFSDTIRPVCLPQYDHAPPAGTLCWISGWGYTQPNEVHIPETLKEAQVSLISTKKCNSSCMYNGEITPRMLCAGHTEGDTDSCQGDSGGPLVCQEDKVWRLVGVVSWGTGCAEPNHPGVYTRVAEFLGWIYDIIEVCCSNNERT